MEGAIPGQVGLGRTRRAADHKTGSQRVERVPHSVFSVSSSCPA